MDLPAPTEGGRGKQPQHYVAMSRARSVLSLIFRIADRTWLDPDLGVEVEAIR